MAGINLRYTLNSIVLTDEPLDWLQTSEVIRREETFGALVSEISGQIRFVKQGSASTESYNIITTAIAANPCQKLTFLVEREDSAGTFSEEFDGLIDLIEVQEDIDKGTYIASVINNDVLSRIFNNQNAPYFFSENRSIDGSTSITDAFSSRNTTTLQDPENVKADETTKLSYAISDVLQAQLDYMTNAGITLDSDLFETDTQQTAIRDIEFTGLVNGEIITIVFQFLSGPDTFVHTWDTGNPSTLVRDLNRFLKVKSATDGKTNYTENKNGDINYLNTWITFSSTANPDMRIRSVNDFSITSVTTDGVATVVIVNVQEPAYGMKNLSFATGNNILETSASVNSIPPALDFRNLLDNLNAMFHISFRIIKTAGVQTFKLERFEDFFLTSSTITVNRVRNLQKRIIDTFNISTCTPGDGHTPEFGDEVHEKASYKSQDCDNSTIDITTTFISDGQIAFDNADGTQTDNNGLEDFYFLLTEDITVSPVIVERIQYNDNIGLTSETFTYQPYNTYLTNLQKIKNNFFRLADNIGNGDDGTDSLGNSRTIIITNDADPSIVKEATFEAPISYTNFQSIKNGQTEQILFNIDGLTNQIGWIQEISYKKDSGLTQFTLLTE